MNGEREQIISFLLQACDAKNRQIEEMQKVNAEMQKRLAVHEGVSASATDPAAEGPIIKAN